MKTFKYRIYPTGKQAKSMLAVLETCRRLYNYFLAQRKEAYETEKKSISCFTQIKELPKIAIKDKSIKVAYSQTLQDVPKRLDKSFSAFFRRCKAGEKPGYPRFRGQGWYRSFSYPQNNGSFKITENDTKIYLSKIGYVKIAYHRKLKGNIKTCIVTHTQTDKWYVTISCDAVPEKPVKSSTLEVGIDVGLKTFATLSDGSVIANPRFFKKAKKDLAKVQRRLAKQTKRTPERRKAKKIVARTYEKITNKREDFAHKQSRKIVNKYNLIVVEDLNVKPMIIKKDESNLTPLKKKIEKGKRRSISDVAWNSFLAKLTYKAENAGRIIKKINPRNTSKTCSSCGNVFVKQTLEDRHYNCLKCGLSLDRDLNAATNILSMGLHTLEALKKAS